MSPCGARSRQRESVVQVTLVLVKVVVSRIAPATRSAASGPAELPHRDSRCALVRRGAGREVLPRYVAKRPDFAEERSASIGHLVVTCDHVRVKDRGIRAVVGAAVAALAVGDCSASSTEPGHKQVRLGHGQAGESSWRLVASSETDGTLCMDVVDQHGGELGEGGCGFGPAPAYKNPADYGVAILSDGTALFYGPAPVDVVRAVASPDPSVVTDESSPVTTQTPTSTPSSSSPGSNPRCDTRQTPTASAPVSSVLPTWSRPGKWFVLHITGDYSCYRVRFFSTAGRPIAQTDF